MLFNEAIVVNKDSPMELINAKQLEFKATCRRSFMLQL